MGTQVIIRIILLVFGLGVAVSSLSIGQASTRRKTDENLDNILSKIESTISQSTQNIESERYQLAEDFTQRALGEIGVLVEMFMPLRERIQRLLKKERSILLSTKSILRKKRGVSVNQVLDSLILGQTQNREATEKAIRFIRQRPHPLQDKNTSRPPRSDHPDNRKATLSQTVGKLLTLAKDHENDTIASLGKKQLKKAILDETRAIKKLEEALEKLKQTSKQSSSSSKKDKKSSARRDPPKDQKEGKRSEKKSRLQKMSAKDALKKLSQIQKNSRDEKKRRKRESGKVSIHERAPVEKDW